MISFFALFSLLLPLSSAAMTKEELVKNFNEQVQNLSDGLDVSFYVEELGSGELIYSHNGEKPLIPASGMKLITSAAALDILGPSWTTHTQVLAAGKRVGDKLTGDIVVVGAGDPYLVSERLWLLARETARSGIKEVSGGVKVNNLYFDQDRGDLMSLDKGQPYAASLSAASLNFNSIEIHVTPRPDEKKVHVEFGPVPHDYGIIQNDVKLVKGTRRSVNVSSLGMKDGKEVFRVTGEIGRDAKSAIEYSTVEEPEAYLGSVFAAMLRREGIKLGKDYIGTTGSEDGTKIADLESLPLLDLIRLANTYSNNFMAEQIFRILGAARRGTPATKQKGIEEVNAFIKKIPACKDTIVPNGSGLSWEGRVSSMCFVKLLQKSYGEFRGFADLIGSMPVGNGTGTLKSRFGGFGSWFDPWTVRAKTGTLWSRGAVTALIGFVPSKSGEHFVFSVIMNHKVKGDGPIAQMRQWEEKNISYLRKFDGT